MFLRFVTAELDDESHKELGVFHAAGKLRDSGSLSEAEETLLQEIRRLVQYQPGKTEEIHFCQASLLPQEAKRDLLVQGFSEGTPRQDA